MPYRKKIKIEFTDIDGGKYAISLDGNISREKVLQVMDLIDLMGAKEEEQVIPIASKETTFFRLYELIERRFALGSFGSADILEAYEDHYHRPIRLSTISTYLSRLAEKGLLERQRSSGGWLYRRVRLNATQI